MKEETGILVGRLDFHCVGYEESLEGAFGGLEDSIQMSDIVDVWLGTPTVTTTGKNFKKSYPIQALVEGDVSITKSYLSSFVETWLNELSSEGNRFAQFQIDGFDFTWL